MHGIDHSRVGRSFHSGADQYDRHTPVQQRVVRQLVVALAAEFRCAPQRILDIGCGTGQLLSQLAVRYPQATLHGLDLAPNMLRLAADRLAGAATLVQGDAEQLPFVDGSFDLVVSSSTFQWLEQFDRCFSEVRRVLAPGGLFCFALFGAGTLGELRTCWRDALTAAGRLQQEGQDGTHHFHSRDEVVQGLVDQGFECVAVKTVCEQVWYPDVPQLLQAIKRIGAGTARPASGGGLGWRRVLHDMAARYRERFGTDQGVPASYQVIYGSGRR